MAEEFFGTRLSGDRELIRRLEIAGKKLPLVAKKRMEKAGRYLRDSVRRQIRGHREINPHHVLGNRSYDLKNSIGFNRGKGFFKTEKIGRNWRVSFGSNLVYGPVHEYGLEAFVFGRFKVKMPARPFFAPGIAQGKAMAEKIAGAPLDIGEIS